MLLLAFAAAALASAGSGAPNNLTAGYAGAQMVNGQVNAGGKPGINITGVNITQLEANVSVDVVHSLLHDPYGTIEAVIAVHTYTAFFLLMLLEGSGFPVPSELVIPLAGYFASKGLIDPVVAFIAVLSGTTFGCVIDYYIGYLLGRDFFYTHLTKIFRVKKEDMDKFERWFLINGTFAVFVSRLLPVVRSAMSFPAGFARMPMGPFLAYSIAGLVLWDGILMAFGYFVISTGSAILLATGLGVFTTIFYAISHGYLAYVKRKEAEKAQRGQVKARKV